ncbi:MAG TPA: VOC family protein [Steroidobacteraceae bacterium]|jgi:catechol 2,3-dioxygenase-like lactoylglutathione lyase family enzyme
MIRGIHHISLHTHNLERLASFYGAAFGFVPAAPQMRLDREPLVDRITGIPNSILRLQLFEAWNCFVEIIEWEAPAGREVGPLRPNDCGYTHFCVDVTDIDAEYKRLAAVGMSFLNDEPVTVGVIRTVYGRDPDGNIIEIQQVPDGHVYSLRDPGRLSPRSDRGSPPEHF